MDEAQLEGKLKELVKEFGGAADPRYKKLMMFTGKSGEDKKPEKSADSLEESLDYLRVCIKYQLFDLEATRRENEYLKKILGENRDRGPE